MKPSLEEVMLKILELTRQLGSKKHYIKVEQLTEEMDAHPEDLMPSLLQLERDAVISFDSKKRAGIRLLTDAAAA